MPAYKATFFFSFKKTGYSFSLYRQETTIGAAFTAATRLRNLTMPLLGVGVTSEYIRVSEEQVDGDSLTDEEIIGVGGTDAPTGQWNRTIMGSVDDPPDPGFTSIMIKLGASSANKGRMYLRLIPDSCVIGGSFIPAASWVTAFGKWRTELTNSTPWQIYVIPKVANRKKKLVEGSINANIPGKALLDAAVLPTFLTGDVLRISGFSGQLAGLNGIHTVIGNVGIQFNIDYPQTITGNATEFPKNAYYLPQKKEYANLSRPDVDWSRIVKRGSGRPFGQPVGRRKTKV